MANRSNQRSIDREGVYEYSEFTGLRNGIDPESFTLSDLDAALNCDIDDALRIKRRKGYEIVIPGSFHSIWSDGSIFLAVRNETELVRIFPDYSVTVLRSDLTPQQPMSYARLAFSVGYSNGMENGIADEYGTRTWGIEPPINQPAAVEIGGALPPGRYLFAVTYERGNRSGRWSMESGTPDSGVIDITQGGIRFMLPASPDPGTEYMNMYISRRDGEQMHWVGRVGNTTPTFDYTSEPAMVWQLTTQFLGPPPVGQLVSIFNGRALVARENVLYYSEPYAPGLFDLRKNFPLRKPITLIAPMESGVYLGTSIGVFWLDGKDPSQWNWNNRFEYSALQGTADYCTADMIFDGKGSGLAVVFHTKEGICVGLEGGSISNLTQGRYDIPTQERGAGVVRRHRGMVQYVSVLQGHAVPLEENILTGDMTLPLIEVFGDSLSYIDVTLPLIELDAQG